MLIWSINDDSILNNLQISDKHRLELKSKFQEVIVRVFTVVILCGRGLVSMTPCKLVLRIAFSFLSFCNKHESCKYVTIMRPLSTALQICKIFNFVNI